MTETESIPDTADVAMLLTSERVTCSFGSPPPAAFGDGRLDVALEPVAPAPGTNEPPGWTLHWSCDDTVISATAFERLIAHYDVLLTSALSDPDIPLRELPMLTAVEMRQLSAWTATEVERPGHTVIDLLARCATHHPNSEAVTGPNGALTYGELQDRVTQLAGRLRAAGLTSGARVGVLMERSPGLYIAMLAVMKAGAAYLPLDPDHPHQRIATVLDDSSASMVLTDVDRGAAFDGSPARVVRVSSGGIAELPDAETLVWAEPTAEDLAYVIYTSGTTGHPKGVEIPHKALTNLVLHFDSELALGEGDTVGGVTTVAFDMSVLELFLPLVRGARLAILPRATVTDGFALRDALRKYDLSFMQATPMTWRMLIDAGWEGSSRLTAVCGGETTPPDLAEQLRARVGAAWNLYGPSETTVWSTGHRIKDTSGPIPVGRPITNTILRVLDEHGQLVPIGVSGELYIGGAGVARGYLGRPELTEERFVDDPHSGRHQVLYRTGDLARWSEDGELEFLGRIDRQVKIRGYRIELEEIEAVLNRLPGVRHGVVDVCENTAGQQQLIGYVVPDSRTEPKPQEITAALSEVLPDYMVPRPIITLPELPLSANGKILRDRLPSPQHGGRTAPQPPSYGSELEERLAGIWAQVLVVDAVFPEDDFFDLGGTSLLAQRVAARVQAELNVRLRLSALMKHSTVPALAASLQEHVSLG
ncbi:amino acid adenylation domain-containing protein [Streptomyces sp. NPDC126933]|uniref:non-ribosomal peptide synthetase n=1 Tax=unclassified Streptomyces TaxID=2593676 RepID=UPI003661E768